MTIADAKYFSLATFRKDGRKVATPVWFATNGDVHYVFSAGDAGKVKRLRNSNRAEVAACDVRGKLLGEWQEASAALFDDPEEVATALALLRKKYGWQMRMADWGARLAGRYGKRGYIRVTLAAQA